MSNAVVDGSCAKNPSVTYVRFLAEIAGHVALEQLRVVSPLPPRGSIKDTFQRLRWLRRLRLDEARGVTSFQLDALPKNLEDLWLANPPMGMWHTHCL